MWSASFPSSWFRFLPPFAPRELPRFLATMAALTPARTRRNGLLPTQVSTVCHDNFPAYPAQPPSTIRFPTSDEMCRSVRSRLSPQASPFPSRLAIVAGRIGFTCVWVCGFASGCSPPRFTATQLPSAPLPFLVSEGLRLSLVVLMVTSFALGLGLRTSRFSGLPQPHSTGPEVPRLIRDSACSALGPSGTTAFPNAWTWNAARQRRGPEPRTRHRSDQTS
jgi:hypothetical protein